MTVYRVDTWPALTLVTPDRWPFDCENNQTAGDLSKIVGDFLTKDDSHDVHNKQWSEGLLYYLLPST